MSPRSGRSSIRAFGCALLLCLVICACGGLEPESFGGGAPHFEPDKFFAGPTHSWGVIEDRSGNPTSRFRTDAVGRWDGDDLIITQHFHFEDGRRQQRVWRLQRIDDHRYEATANDVVGVATGIAYGNAFLWEYTLELKPGNFLSRVHLKHWMYLLDGGEAMMNRVTISKLGVIVAEVTEYFRRHANPLTPTRLRHRERPRHDP